MDSEDSRSGSVSQGPNSPAPSVSFSLDKKVIRLPSSSSVSSPLSSPNTITPTSKGVENAKKRLRAFSIQKKAPLTPVTLAKTANSSGGTVFIGKLSNAKPPSKPEDASEPKKPPKPPKPGTVRKNLQEHIDQQKKTLSEIEDMKRKMELVELGIPLGLICPAPNSDKAMPTKAMPPIKSFLDPAKVDEIILEAKKAKAEGREFKFDYQKLLPGYDNPFQRKRDEQDRDKKSSEREHRSKSSDKRRSDKYDRRHSHRKDDKEKTRDKDKHRDEKKSKDKDGKKGKDVKKVLKSATKDAGEKDTKETDVNLSDYLVCDSWSLDNDDKNSTSSPKIDDKLKIKDIPLPTDKPLGQFKDSFKKVTSTLSPSPKPITVQKLQPVIDSFEYEIDPNDEEMLDMFDEDSTLEKFAKKTTKTDNLYDSPIDMKLYNELSIKDTSMDASSDEKFLQSVINEIKQGDLMDEGSQDKGLVEYDMSPPKDDRSVGRGSVTPELKDLNLSQRSDYSDGYKSVESGYKSTESGCKSNVSMDSERSMRSVDQLEYMEGKFSKTTVDSLETWSFVLKICQPLLFRHDKNKCYKETRSSPKIWYTQNPKVCNCVKDRSVVYEELEMFKMTLVDRVYGCDQIPDPQPATCRTWYPRASQYMVEKTSIPLAPDDDWEAEDSQAECKSHRRSTTPQRNEEIYLDREYQRFMQAVLSDVSEKRPETSRSTTPVTNDAKKKDDADDKKKAKKPRLSSEGWSQESDVEEEMQKSRKKIKVDKVKEKSRKRKHSSSSLSDSDDQSKKKKSLKKKNSKKSKSSKRKLSKKYLKKLKLKKKKKILKLDKSDDDSDDVSEKERKKKDKKAKKKKLQKLKRKNQKKKKGKAKSPSSSSSSSSTSSSSSDSSSDESKKRGIKKKKEEIRRKKRKQYAESNNDELFDVNILNNIKTEKVTDDEKQGISPRKKPREIINVKELQNDFVGNNILIKKEGEADKKNDSVVTPKEVEDKDQTPVCESLETSDGSVEAQAEILDSKSQELFKEPQDPSRSTPQLRTITEESNQSQSSQESIVSKEATFEKDESHLRALSPNSNYSFNDVIAASGNVKEQDDNFGVNFEKGNYEMYEQMALSYSSELASQDVAQIPLPPEEEPTPPVVVEDDLAEVNESVTVPESHGAVETEAVGVGQGVQDGQEVQEVQEGQEQRIETVVRVRRRGEIKCDWRPPPHERSDVLHHRDRPSRWGLKPGEVNIVLTGGNSTEQYPIQTVVDSQPVYKIQSLANRTDGCSIDYDEAYMDTYGALDRLQYGDCFGAGSPHVHEVAPQHAQQHAQHDEQPRAQLPSTLDERISRVLQDTVLGDVAKEVEELEAEKDGPEKGILITKTAPAPESRVNKRVSFADGYKPGQDSDVEEPPAKKKKSRRYGCAWPCPASHADHVPLWDALPPPPPPPGSPPPPPAPPAPPLHLLRRRKPASLLPTPPHHLHHKFDPSGPIPGFMPPEPPPGLLF